MTTTTPTVQSPPASAAASPYWGARAPSPETTTTTTPGGTVHTRGFSKGVAFCFTINYILGTGFLTVPWAFCRGGLLLSTLCMMLCGLISDMAKNYLLETMAFGEALLDDTLHWKKKKQTKTTSTNDNNNNNHALTKPIQVYSPKYMTTSNVVATSPFLQRKQEQRRLADHQDSRDNTDDDNDDDEERQHATESTSLLLSLGHSNAHKVGGKPPKAAATTSPSSYQRSESLPGTPTTSTGRRRLLLAPSSRTKHDDNIDHAAPLVVVGQRKFEVNALCRVFLGKHAGLKVYTTCLCLYIYCTLWAYTCVFASAMAKAAPLDQLFDNQQDPDNDATTTTTTTTTMMMISSLDSYLMYAILFATAVVPLSCLELDEQVVVQVVMTLARFVMLFFMLATTGELATQQQEQQQHLNGMANTTTLTATAMTFQPAPLVRWQGLSEMLPIVVFSQIFHHSVPGLSHPVANKRELKSIFASTALFSTLAYTLLGLSLGSAFGMSVEQSSNLHWNEYHAIDGTWWTQLVSIYVVCFPALDVVSAFPLNAITLGNNLLGAAYGSKIQEAEVSRAVCLFVARVWRNEPNEFVSHSAVLRFVSCVCVCFTIRTIDGPVPNFVCWRAFLRLFWVFWNESWGPLPIMRARPVLSWALVSPRSCF